MPDLSYHYVDIDFLNELCDSDMEMLQAIVHTSLESIPEQIEELKVAVLNDDISTAAFGAHKLKGSFNFIGCKAAANIAHKMEDDCRVNDTEHLHTDFARLEEVAALVFPELRRLLDGLTP